MATNPLPETAPSVTNLALTKVAYLMSQHSRADLASFITVAIDLLDAAEPDPDLEDDDPAGQCSEDEISCAGQNGRPPKGDGPGCEISDPDSAVDDNPCDGDEDLEPDEAVTADYGIDQTTGPLPPVPAAFDAAMRREHRDRIRRERCRPVCLQGEARPHRWELTSV